MNRYILTLHETRTSSHAKRSQPSFHFIVGILLSGLLLCGGDLLRGHHHVSLDGERHFSEHLLVGIFSIHGRARILNHIESITDRVLLALSDHHLLVKLLEHLAGLSHVHRLAYLRHYI